MERAAEEEEVEKEEEEDEVTLDNSLLSRLMFSFGLCYVLCLALNPSLLFLFHRRGKAHGGIARRKRRRKKKVKKMKKKKNKKEKKKTKKKKGRKERKKSVFVFW